MFYAIWLVCILGGSCQIIEEERPVFFKEEAKCHEHAASTAQGFAAHLTERQVPASIKFTCKKATDV